MASAAVQWIIDHSSHVGDECLIFPFYRHPNGYGVVWVGSCDGRRRTGAHRRMCEEVHGEPPTSAHEAAHSCGNGNQGCVHPGHLRWATRKENAQDAVAHGVVFNPYGPPGTTKDGSRDRQSGENHGRAILSASDVDQIRGELSSGGRVKDLANRFGVHRSTISLIKSGKNWAAAARHSPGLREDVTAPRHRCVLPKF